MIDDFFDRFRNNGNDDTDTEPPEIDIDSFEDEAKRAAAFEHRYRCHHCNIPNFREDLYLVDVDSDAVPACESCLRANGQSDAITEDRQVPPALTGRLSYLIDRIEEVETLRHRQHGDVAVKEIEEDGTAHMGAFARKMIEGKHSEPQDNVWLGYYQKGNRMRELGIEYEDLFVHTYIQGTTGGGKTTTAYNMLVQFAWAMFGFCCIDPHGDLIEDLLEAIPPHRRDDIVLFDPTGDDDRKAALNLLEIEKEPGDPGYHEAVDAAVADVRSGMRRGGDWGQRMGPICDNLARGMIMHPDTFTFLDFRDILIHEDRRQQFADKIQEEGFFFADYTQQIAEMGKIELNPLIRRLNGWTSSKTSRDIISHGESTMSFDEIINENKILLVNANLPDEDMQRMISSAIIRRLARAAKAVPRGERTPFMMLADEVDDIINEEMNLDDLLSNMRKFKFGMVLMTQYLKKLDDRNTEKAIRKLCNTTVTFRDPDGKFAERSTSPSANLDQYRALVKMRINGNTKGPYEMSGFAPYPARRTPEEATEWMRKPALKRHGVVAGEIEPDDTIITRDRRQTILESIYDSAVIDGGEAGNVRIDDAMPRIIDRLDADIDHPSEIDAMIADIPQGEDGDIVRSEDANGNILLRVTAQGRKHIWKTGDGIQSGGIRHSQLLIDAYEPLTKLGTNVNIIEQDTGRLPDGVLRVDHHADTHPVVERLTQEHEAAIEAERSTGDHFPGKTANNLVKAINDGTHCLLLARPETAPKIWRTLTNPPFLSARTVNGRHRFYHLRNLVIDGEMMLRPDGPKETVWIPETDANGFILLDSDGNEHHRFGNERAVFEDAGAYPHTAPAKGDVPKGWKPVKAPFIPQREFEDGIPDQSEWDIIVVPTDAEEPDDLAVYRDGDEIALTEVIDHEQPSKDDVLSELGDILDEK